MSSPEETAEHPIEVPFFLRPGEVLSTEPSLLREMAEKASGIEATVLQNSAGFLEKVNKFRLEGNSDLPQADQELIRRVIEKDPNEISSGGLNTDEMKAYQIFILGPTSDRVRLRGYHPILLAAIRQQKKINPADPDLAEAIALSHKLLEVYVKIDNYKVRTQYGKQVTPNIISKGQGSSVSHIKKAPPPPTEEEHKFFDPKTGKTTTQTITGPRKLS